MPWFIPETRLDPTEQLPFLKQIKDNPNRNFWLKGFAGSGKSVLLLHWNYRTFPSSDWNK